MTALTPGTRVVLTATAPWPERRGSVGTIVAWPDGYPGPGTKRAQEVLVLLDDDPLTRGRARGEFSDGEGDDRARGWTCTMKAKDVERISA